MHDDPDLTRRIPRDDVLAHLARPRVWLVPVSPRVALRVVELPRGSLAIVLVDGVPVGLVDGVEC